MCSKRSGVIPVVSSQAKEKLVFSQRLSFKLCTKVYSCCLNCRTIEFLLCTFITLTYELRRAGSVVKLKAAPGKLTELTCPQSACYQVENHGVISETF